MNKAVLQTHCADSVLSMKNKTYHDFVMDFFLNNLESDLKQANSNIKLVDGGDLTTNLLFPGEKNIEAQIVCKKNGYISGLEELRVILKFLNISFKTKFSDGDKILTGQSILNLTGEVQHLLAAERTILNFLQRMSGITTLTKQFVKIAGSTLIVPTRKTWWGFLDKKACVVGGAGTHRLNLADAVMIKDTHIDALDGDFETIFKRLVGAKNLGRFFEIEVNNFQQAEQVGELYLKYGAKFKVPFVLMLDNILPAQIKPIVKIYKKSKILSKVILEASGGINLKNLPVYARTGVDVISIGALTHSSTALDFSMKIVK